ncbi:hypothetical protein I7I53_10031 [Histoplasma capsulatum var. duboisii H88]|uniref:Uncharacterized protein n=1 Tax=Ajellomyces capsulatus (strain H88) TaxID=544711 RepID=A0A8A1L6Q5_AJEC8|nr:hypothetical protein I7I53_10031 [Histoplasma capsulatum var. duboisii H88]
MRKFKSGVASTRSKKKKNEKKRKKRKKKKLKLLLSICPLEVGKSVRKLHSRPLHPIPSHLSQILSIGQCPAYYFQVKDQK